MGLFPRYRYSKKLCRPLVRSARALPPSILLFPPFNYSACVVVVITVVLSLARTRVLRTSHMRSRAAALSPSNCCSDAVAMYFSSSLSVIA